MPGVHPGDVADFWSKSTTSTTEPYTPYAAAIITCMLHVCNDIDRISSYFDSMVRLLQKEASE